MLRAIIFDFNGILVDDEPIHLELFQKVLREEGISLSTEDYYARYLGMDDRDCFRAAYKAHGKELDEPTLSELIRHKSVYYREVILTGPVIFPGVKEIVPALFKRYPLAIASGALRSEIDMILADTGLIKYFQVIVSTEDISKGKPEPEIFMKALSLLNQSTDKTPILPSECLVIEDSKEGVLGSHRAGMRCLAVTNSHPAEKLKEAEAVINGLDEITEDFLEKLLS